MASRTAIVCLCEGEQGKSIDPVFITSLINTLNPKWIRKHGANRVRVREKGGRKDLIAAMPEELRQCLKQGGNTTLMVWADLDDDMKNGNQLVEEFWKTAADEGITKEEFSKVVFIFAKDRLENWVEYLEAGTTDENVEAPRVKSMRRVRDAARLLANRCQKQQSDPSLPPSLKWSCKNWHRLKERMSS